LDAESDATPAKWLCVCLRGTRAKRCTDFPQRKGNPLALGFAVSTSDIKNGHPIRGDGLYVQELTAKIKENLEARKIRLQLFIA